MKLSEILAKPLKLIGGGKLNLKGFCKRIVDKEIGGEDEFPYEYIEYPDIHLAYNPEDWDDKGSDEEPYWILEKNITIPNIKNEEPYKLFAVGNISYEEQTDSSYLNDSTDVGKNKFSFDNIIEGGYLFIISFDNDGLVINISVGEFKPTSTLYINISKLIAINAAV